MKKILKRILMFLGGIVLFIIIIFAIIYFTSDKLVCKSDKSSITLMYNKDNIKGYIVNGGSYDLAGQQAIAKEIGINNYLEQFEIYWKNTTNGSCKRKN